MAKIQLIKPGDVLWVRKNYRMGNTTMRTTGVYPMYVKEVDYEKGRVLAHFNYEGNPPRWYSQHQVDKWLKKRPASRGD